MHNSGIWLVYNLYKIIKDDYEFVKWLVITGAEDEEEGDTARCLFHCRLHCNIQAVGPDPLCVLA